MRGRKGVSPAALVTLAAALVLLTAVTSYIAYANTLRIHDSLRNNLKVEVEMRRELKISLISGLPPGVSPKAYVVIHEMSGYQEVLYDLVYADNSSNIRHVRLNIDMNEGDCVVLTPFYLASNSLPDFYTRYNGSNLVIHSSKAVGNAVPRELKPDEIYPCARRGGGRPQYEILLRVALDGNLCLTPQCRDLLTPSARPNAYVLNVYTVFNITATPSARINNVNYTFIGWLVYKHPQQSNQNTYATPYTMNPLPLLVDEDYDVVAVYASRRSDGSWNWDWHRNCFRNEYGEIDCRF
jgi:hypothetical protein